MITVNVETPSKNIRIKTDYKTQIEDLIIEACKTLNIGPIARHLFAVRVKSTTTWLHLNAYVEQIPSNNTLIVINKPDDARNLQSKDPEIAKLINQVIKNGNRDPDLLVENGILYRKQLERVVFLPNCVRSKDFELRIRFNIPDINRLLAIDRNAFDFYFNQIKSVVSHQLPKWIYKTFKGELNGLSVLDMYRAMLELKLTKKEVINDYRKYIPRVVLKRHRFFIKKPMLKQLDMLLEHKFGYNSSDVKSGYLDQFKKIVPDYHSEIFQVMINDVKKPSSSPSPVLITVDPYHTDYPGIRIKYDGNEEIEHVCTIDDLCYISIRKEGTVEISRKNGIPLYLKFHSVPDMMSFVSLLDGYYRLSVKWTFNLCSDLPTPSLQKLQPLKCHGPISDEFSYRKLKEKRNNEFGCFILRESDRNYDEYCIDVCTETGSNPVTFKIEMTNNKQYRFCTNEKITYLSIPSLIAAHKSEPANFILRECLPPSEFDQSNLLICQINGCADSQKSSNKRELPTNDPLCIDGRTLFSESEPLKGTNQFTAVYRGSWIKSTSRKTVALKVLRERHKAEYLQEFLSLSSRWGFVNSNAVVNFYGFSLSNPVSMISEYLPLGRLDHYLENVEVEEVDLVEAATYLANALWYLEEVGFVHGNIRCRKILVSSHTKNSFTIKLSDPGLHDRYTDADLPWIPLEYHYERLNEARNSVMADMWAFGTTLWEIFSLGKRPPGAYGNNIKKLYRSGETLSKPKKCPEDVFQLMRECWIKEPDCRKRPQAAMRDINRILYQVHNARQGHAYTTVLPLRDNQPDCVSNKSKKSDDLSSNSISKFSLSTFVDDGDVSYSPDLMFFNDNTNTTSNVSISTKSSLQTYQFFENAANSNMSIINEAEYSQEDKAISSMQSIFELDLEWTLILNGRIGEGFHGEVFRGTLQPHCSVLGETQKVAVKKLKSWVLASDNVADFDREINIMKQLDHPNIVQFKGIIRDPELCLVLEHINDGSLALFLKDESNREQLSTILLLKFASDIAKGMAYLSEKKIVHRDLAARNILIANENNEKIVKISDFGLAQFTDNNNYYMFKTKRQLPVDWYAPESIERGKFSPQSDVWSYGVTLYEMFSYGEWPRLPIEEPSVENMLNALKNGIRLPRPAECPGFVYEEIMQKCWQYEAANRPNFHDLCVMIERLRICICLFVNFVTLICSSIM